MKALLPALLLAGVAAADEASDRAGVTAAVKSLVTPLHAIATADVDGIGEMRTVLREGPQQREALTYDFWPFPLPVTDPSAVECSAIRFVTPDVALAEGSVRQHPALFIVKKENGVWKIASVRFLRR
jgi:hypothetical protein